MKNEVAKQPAPISARMVEDETAERVKKRLRDLGLIVNAGVGKTAKPTNQKKVIRSDGERSIAERRR